MAGTIATQASATETGEPIVSHLAGTNVSYSWSGYVAGGGTPGAYSDVTADWVIPTVTCTTRGIVLFWVGMDGAASGSTVERTGVGADCTSGSPQYFFQFFTGIEGSPSPTPGGTGTWQGGSTPVPTYTVKPGDSITAEVSFDSHDTQYNLSLGSSEGWSAHNTIAAPTGYQNSSAEIVTEAVSYNGATTALPSFAPAHFTQATINGATPAQSGAQTVNMIDSAGSVIAATSSARPTRPIRSTIGRDDGIGADFTVTYTGP